MARKSFDANKKVGSQKDYDMRYNTPKNLVIDLLKLIPFEKEDFVVDAGSGTTAISCKELERQFLGCEINPEYVKIIRKRLTQTSVRDFNPLNEESLISVKRESTDSPNSPHDSSTIKEEANFS